MSEINKVCTAEFILLDVFTGSGMLGYCFCVSDSVLPLGPSNRFRLITARIKKKKKVKANTDASSFLSDCSCLH